MIIFSRPFLFFFTNFFIIFYKQFRHCYISCCVIISIWSIIRMICTAFFIMTMKISLPIFTLRSVFWMPTSTFTTYLACIAWIYFSYYDPIFISSLNNILLNSIKAPASSNFCTRLISF